MRILSEDVLFIFDEQFASVMLYESECLPRALIVRVWEDQTDATQTTTNKQKQ